MIFFKTYFSKISGNLLEGCRHVGIKVTLKCSCYFSYTTLRQTQVGNMSYSYTPRTLRACCSQSKFRMLKIRESSARALFLYNCTPNISRGADASVSVA